MATEYVDNTCSIIYEKPIPSTVSVKDEPDTVDAVRFSRPSRSTGYSTPQMFGRYEGPNVQMILKASAAIVKVCLQSRVSISL